jgi:hypothetical protein
LDYSGLLDNEEEVHMRLTADKDFTIERVQIDVNLREQPESAIRAIHEEALQAGMELGLWAPGGLDALGEQTAAKLGTLSLREQLLSTAEEGAQLYEEAITGINKTRAEADRIPLLRTEDYVERAEDWLTPERERAAAFLLASHKAPRLLVPRLTHPITGKENVEAWHAAMGEANLGLNVREEQVLDNWTADELSGFDPELEEETPFEILPTAHDAGISGSPDDQKAALEALRGTHPRLDIASIFNGALLVRWSPTWHSTSVRAINLQPKQVKAHGDYVTPSASISEGDGGDYAYIGVQGSVSHQAARLVVR